MVQSQEVLKTNELVSFINGKVGTVSVGLSDPSKSVVDNLIAIFKPTQANEQYIYHPPLPLPLVHLLVYLTVSNMVVSSKDLLKAELCLNIWQVVEYLKEQPEVKTLTVNTKSTGATNATIVLNGVSFTVPLTDDTAGTTSTTATTIRAFSFTGWTTSGSGANVIFTRNTSGPVNGAFTFSHATAVATYATTTAAAKVTDATIKSGLNISKSAIGYSVIIIPSFEG